MSTRSFTEAVPLSLSSMAHLSYFEENQGGGVLDGLRQVLQHTLLSSVNYARMVHRSREWTLHDLCTSEYAWLPSKADQPPRDLPWSLSRLGFKHQYSRHAWIYFKPLLTKQQNISITPETEKDLLKGWDDKPFVLGRISLLYASQELLTQEELDGTADSSAEDVPPLVLYKILVEYRSLPATGSQQAVQAEELSMLSFGGSVDDDVKLGALASLYDDIAKYVLEIYSVRGKKYKFDLIDSTLSDGSLPTLSSTGESDPFVKSLCVTVTDHASSSVTPDEDNKTKDKYAITRMHLTLDGNLRKGKHSFDNLPSFDYIVKNMQQSFLFLHKPPPLMATAVPSGQTLLLDPDQVGKLYINGRYVTTWGNDPRLGCHFPALFGMDLHSVSFWHGRIMDFDALKKIYAQMWQEILIDAKLANLDIGKKLLYRLMQGKDPDTASSKNGAKDDNDDDESESADDDDDDDQKKKTVVAPPPPPPDTSIDCLESIVMQSKRFDPVGISAKALATKFSTEFGKNSFPCLTHEVEWVKDQLPGRKPVVVPQRLLNVLRRGGYFSVKMTSNDLWFAESRPPKDGKEQELVAAALKELEHAGCTDILPEHIVFSPGANVDVDDVISQKAVCRYNDTLRQYHVSEKFLVTSLSSSSSSAIKNGTNTNGDAKTVQEDGDEKEAKKRKIDNNDGEDIQKRARVLGLHIAQQHPDGNVLVRYLLRSQS